MTGADPTQRSWFRGERALAMALAIAGVGAFALWIALAAQRIGYPYELEWMEGAMVDEAVRVRDGLPVYGPPGVEHVPFLYTPLFYYLGALAMAVVGEGFTALRLVSTLATNHQPVRRSRAKAITTTNGNQNSAVCLVRNAAVTAMPASTAARRPARRSSTGTASIVARNTMSLRPRSYQVRSQP